MNTIKKEKLVKELYEKYPYPSRKIISKDELKYFAKWATSALKKDDSFWKGKTVLELGCGTGELASAIALSGGKVMAIDFSKSSINHAKKLSKKLGTNKKINFIEKNMLSIKEGEFGEKFDVVIALGSIHHTINPRKAFKIACENTKKGGIIIVGLYNKYSRFRHRMKRVVLRVICGDNIEKRIVFGEKLFGANGEKIHSADKYGQAHESYHSINEVLKWFNEKGISFLGSKPEFETPIIDELKWLMEKRNAFFVMSGKKT